MSIPYIIKLLRYTIAVLSTGSRHDNCQKIPAVVALEEKHIPIWTPRSTISGVIFLYIYNSVLITQNTISLYLLLYH